MTQLTPKLRPDAAPENPQRAIRPYLRGRYADREGPREPAAAPPLTEFAARRFLFTLDLVFISGQIIRFGGTLLPTQDGKEP